MPPYQQMIFVNLPVDDLDAAKKFFTELGYTLNAQFTNDDAACVVISDTIIAMLLTEKHYAEFTDKKIADAATSEMVIALSARNRAEVDALVDRAISLGGSAGRTQDLGFMYNRAFDDLDGHTWEMVWMDPAAIEG